jgi:hypothetical protein
MSQCCAFWSDVRCTKEARWAATVSCVHEHIAVDLLCDDDKTTTERLEQIMICVACEQHPSEPHKCRAFISIGPIEVPVRAIPSS